MTDYRNRITRRSFLTTAGAVAAAASLPAWFAEECAAQLSPASATTQSPSNQVRLALIGCGGQGTSDARNALRYGTIVAVCDVDESRIAKVKQYFPEAQGYSDFRKLLERKDVDAVICATVDHWHALVSTAAMKAGKDVYCEKPLTLCIDEGKRLIEVQRKTRRVLQTGSQQRSGIRFRLACDLIRNGRIGKVQKVEVWLPAGLREGPFKVLPVPTGFNYDFWTGPTPKADYVKERAHLYFRYWWEHAGGTMTDWGAHHNDIVLWCLELDGSGPVSIEGKQLLPMIPGGYTAASEYEVVYTYANGVVHTCKSTTANDIYGGVKDRDGQQHGIKFIGTDGWIWVTRDNQSASAPEILRAPLPAGAKRVPVSNDHMGNFIECIKSRKDPIASVAIGHRSATVCHLGTIAIRLGRKLRWDPVKEHFIGDSEANKYLARKMRKPYDYKMV